MDAFQPIINLLVILTCLSIISERITNVLKLRHAELRHRPTDQPSIREREYRIALRSIFVGMGVALAMKANFFVIVANLHDPWSTFGWVQVDQSGWVQNATTRSFGLFLFAVAGCLLTGFALGFGSKFWHDTLGTVYEVRNSARRKVELMKPDKD